MKYSGIIYRIYNDTSNYIGSSTRSLTYRHTQHMGDYRKWKSGKDRYYISVFSIFEGGDYKKEILENVSGEFEDKRSFVYHLRQKENDYITTYGNVVNILRSCITKSMPIKRERVACDICGLNLAKNSLARHKHEACVLNPKSLRYQSLELARSL